MRAVLGATATDLRRMVIGQGVRLTLAGVAMVLVLISPAACDAPARRASRIEPAAAVRTD